MRKCVNLFLMIALLAGVTGCALRPGELEVTPRDRKVYKDPGGKPLARNEETAQKVAVLVSQGATPTEKTIYSALDSNLTSLISDFSFFTIVERSNLAALNKENLLSDLQSDQQPSIEIPEADYLITARLASANMKPVTVPPNSYEAVVNVDFRFYEKPTGRCVLTQDIEATAPGYVSSASGGQATAKLVEAAQEAAKRFAIELGSRYAPEARVLETRGGGRAAKISIGTDYGVTNKAKVEFYEYVDNSDVVEGATREPSPVGYGIVLETAQSSAWVEVQRHNDVEVCRGHYVRLAADQSRGMKEKATTGFGETVKGAGMGLGKAFRP